MMFMHAAGYIQPASTDTVVARDGVSRITLKRPRAATCIEGYDSESSLEFQMPPKLGRLSDSDDEQPVSSISSVAGDEADAEDSARSLSDDAHDETSAVCRSRAAGEDVLPASKWGRLCRRCKKNYPRAWKPRRFLRGVLLCDSSTDEYDSDAFSVVEPLEHSDRDSDSDQSDSCVWDCMDERCGGWLICIDCRRSAKTRYQRSNWFAKFILVLLSSACLSCVLAGSSEFDEAGL